MADGDEVKNEARQAVARKVVSALAGRDVLVQRPLPCKGGLWALQAFHALGRLSRSASRTACGAARLRALWKGGTTVKQLYVRTCKAFG